MKKLFLLLIALLSVLQINAQSMISGKVVDDKDIPLPGVSVQVKNTLRGTFSGIDGSYTIMAQPSDALIFRMLGMTPNKESVGNRTIINVTMIIETNLIDEVVVIGYGVIKRSNLTGSVSSVKAEDLLKITSLNPEQGLQGKVTGVQVSSTSGAPGAGATISRDTYRYGYMNNGSILNGNIYYGITLPMGGPYGGPLFFTHYPFLGLDPRGLVDGYVNYWDQNVAHAMINWKYCEANPLNYVGYSADCWGLTASDNQSGYSAHSPVNDLGVISPTAAVSSLPYTPEQSMAAIRHFYYMLGDRLWGHYGFYDAFNITAGWWGTSNIAIDQGPMVVMIENYRTGLIWDLFMSCPEVQNGLRKLEFQK